MAKRKAPEAAAPAAPAFTLDEIQAIMTLSNAGVQAMGINVYQTVNPISVTNALAKLQEMADIEAAKQPADE